MLKDLWSLKREFLEYCEIEKGQSLLTISNYERYLNRFLVWLEDEKTEELKNLRTEEQKDSHSEPKQSEGEESQLRSFSAESAEKDDKPNKLQANSYKLFPNDINREVIRKYRLYVNRLYDKNGKELKATTQNHHILSLRAFLRYLSMQGIKTVSPDEIALAKTGERKVNFLAAEEYQRLLAAPQKSPRDKAILELLFSTGMRVSELVALNIGDINFERGEIAVLGKGKKVRVVFISDEALDTLVKYLQKRGALYLKTQNSKLKTTTQNTKSKENQNNNIAMSESANDSNETMVKKNNDGEIKYIVNDANKKQPLFLSSRGNRLNVRGIERLVETYAKVAGITKRVSPHTLRHTFATDLLIAGADIRSVQSLLGHSNISTTQVYTHVTDQHLREIHQKFHNRNNTEK